MAKYVMAIDQGTTSSRTIIFDENRVAVASAQKEITQLFPRPGEVEHDPVEIVETVLATASAAIAKAGIEPSDIACIGITSQRETCVVWEKKTGRPIHPAIVWQDRRTAPICSRLTLDGYGSLVESKTGLLLDPYFSATKIAWILDRVPDARSAADNGDLLFGTIDSWLIWNLTGGATHATDATNASRTALFNIETNCWDEELLRLFRVPRNMLPDVKDSSSFFGTTRQDLFGAAISITGVAGDQQASTVGQGCLLPGMIKSTYGTGCFLVLNTGDQIVRSRNRLLSTIVYRLKGRTTYGLEGSIFVAGAAVQWLRDSLKMIGEAHETGALAEAAKFNEDVYLVPAFVGLGAPYWNPDARGAIFGLTRASGVAEFARATLESICFQTRDLLDAMAEDYPRARCGALRVDGGMASSDWMMQSLADTLGQPVERPVHKESTALGAALLAGSGCDLWQGLDEIVRDWKVDTTFKGTTSSDRRELRYRRWQAAVKSTLLFATTQ